MAGIFEYIAELLFKFIADLLFGIFKIIIAILYFIIPNSHF